MIKSYNYKGKLPGNHLLVLGCIHGDEVCGYKAITQIMQKFKNNEMQLQSGMLTIIPICNPIAYQQNTRFIKQNLNRIIKYHKDPQTKEEQFANKICAAIDDCDYLLDIHSMTGNGKAFVCQDFEDKACADFCKSLGTNYCISGWYTMRQNDPAGIINDTMSYANMQGKTAALIECGKHTDLQAVDIANIAIMHAMSFLDIAGKLQKTKDQKYIEVQNVFHKRLSGTFTKNRQHLDAVEKGTIIAKMYTGELLIAPCAGYIILPHKNVEIGGEWFYFGK